MRSLPLKEVITLEVGGYCHVAFDSTMLSELHGTGYVWNLSAMEQSSYYVVAMVKFFGERYCTAGAFSVFPKNLFQRRSLKAGL